MKNLKKLSAAFMLAALFSFSLTSCIDDSVDPIVEAIYANQANLIAAQAAVQNAEAGLLNAQANAEDALATLREAQAAQAQALADATSAESAADVALWEEQLRKLIADNDNAIATAQMTLEIAQAQFDLDMAGLIADLAEAGATEAAGYATLYATYMTKVNASATAILGLQGTLAEKELLIETGGLVTWEYYLAGLNADLAALQAGIVANEAAIAAYEAAIANPSAREAQYADIVAQVAALNADQADLVIQIAEAENVRAAAVAAKADAVSFMTATTGEYAVAEAARDAAQAAIDANQATIDTQTANITAWTTAMNDWAGTKTTLEGDVTTTETAETAADGAVTAAETALGTATPAPSAGDAKIDPSTSLYDDLYNVQLIAADKALELSDMETAFAALTVTYNNAATALNVAQAAWDASTYAADLTTAQNAETAATTALGVAQTDYTNAQSDFVGDTTGFQVTDGVGLHSSGQNFDLGNIGIAGDGQDRTFMMVGSVGETSAGSGLYEVKTLLPTKYIYSELAGVASGLSILNTNAFIWEDLAGTMPIEDLDGTAFPGAADIHATNLHGTTAGTAFVTAIDGGTQLLFVEVEEDDTSVSNLYTFNVATTVLGSEDFSDKDFGSGPSSWTAPLDLTDATASYDSNFDANGEETDPVGSRDTMTAWANLWNAQLEVAKKQYLFDTGDDTLVAAQATFDEQQELFDNGLANIATLEGEVATANTDVTTAGDDITTAVALLGVDMGAVAAGDTPIDAADNAPTTSLTLYEVLWNAKLANLDADAALALHLATDEDDYQALIDAAQILIDDATLELAENTILLTDAQGELDAIQARYDALILTPLYAALTVAVDDATDAKAALEAAKTASEAMETALLLVKTALGTQTDYAGAITTAEGLIATALLDIEKKMVDIAKGEVDLQDVLDAIEDIKQQIEVLVAQMAIDQAIADEYNALLEAALS
jgi:hypothetical protein